MNIEKTNGLLDWLRDKLFPKPAKPAKPAKPTKPTKPTSLIK